MPSRGFSLTEFVVVIFIAVTLIALSIPAFFYLRHQSRQHKMETMVSTVRAGIASWHHQKLINNFDVFPPTLDTNAPRSVCIHCFEEVLESGLRDNLWWKVDTYEYLYLLNEPKAYPQGMLPKGDFNMTYNPIAGSLTVKKI